MPEIAPPCCCGFPAVPSHDGLMWACQIAGTLLGPIIGNRAPVLLSAEEEAELHQFAFRSYLSPNQYPALVGLVHRIVERAS